MSGKDIVSMISSGGTVVIEEVSDSNSSTYPSLASKHARNDNNNISTSKFRGVVAHQSGHWGCQIYANHQRVWLGTFKYEQEAAMAYDSAALKLRSGDSRRNFPFTNITVEEENFQSSYSTEAVLSMIKVGTYRSKFADFLRTRAQNFEADLSLKLMKTQSSRRLTCKQLFQKELTPSDVGKLNRLVIPKKFATKFFSPLSEGVQENAADVRQLSFYDKAMKLWKFRYCYWRSSQSYVFTRGWSGFVKEKQLKANDIICFCLYECRENSKVTQAYYMIDVNNGGHGHSSSLLELGNERVDMGMELQLHLGQRCAQDCMEEENVEGDDGLMVAKPRSEDSHTKSFRLFGAEII
ncbi:hypothetical protein GH714_011088 [Hevea brasiliensis]|uniref:Uncharacterized protein n=1 Tax=Hevea brasiliensis TaxID=3981 RepID=A0A6A6MXE8_HEVBR|nr:hypothetical protein GH714_011088 [Hevea brasiliensis]